MASKITLACVLLVMFLALGASSLVSSEEGVQEHDTLNDGYQLEDQDKTDGQDVDTDIEVGNYKQQQSRSGRARGRQSSKRCGPDVTHWLIRQMNQNKDHHVIKRCGTWLAWIWPWCLQQFADLVGEDNPWDFKNSQSFERGSCPHRCPETVTLCGQCVFHDVPGNIHYGYVGRAATFQRMLLQFAAHRVQKGGIDDPKDQNAIRIGMDLWDHENRRAHFCREVHKHALSKYNTGGCHTCSVKY